VVARDLPGCWDRDDRRLLPPGRKERGTRTSIRNRQEGNWREDA